MSITATWLPGRGEAIWVDDLEARGDVLTLWVRQDGSSDWRHETFAAAEHGPADDRVWTFYGHELSLSPESYPGEPWTYRVMTRAPVPDPPAGYEP